jgi:hypothetical protein
MSQPTDFSGLMFEFFQDFSCNQILSFKFLYKTAQRGGTATIFGKSIEWLVFAGIGLKCQKISQGFMPVSAYADLSDFKLYMSDAGMLTMKSGMATQTILSPLDEDNMFLGMISENYVAQALVCNGFPRYYWKNDNTAELDFVVQIAGEVIPVEVKKGKRTKSASLELTNASRLKLTRFLLD